MTETVELSGRTVRLRPVTKADRDALVAIRSTEAVHRWWGGDDLKADFDADLENSEVKRFTIRDPSSRIIGLIQFTEEQDPDYRHACLDIYVDPAVHRRGHGVDAISALVDFLFDEGGHHRLTIDPAVDNKAAIACYSKVGFKPVGVMRSYESRNDGSWADGLLMDMLSSDRPRTPPASA